MTEISYKTKEEVFGQAKVILNKTLRQLMPADKLVEAESAERKYDSRKKGLLGEFIEWYVFGKKPDSRSEADFNIAGVELKTTPLKKHQRNVYTAKERLVFSMIDYDKVITETWDTSSFLKKNRFLLLMFYLYIRGESIIDYEFKFIELFDLLKNISSDDILQIQKDWEFITEKIRRGEAHLLSEGDTYYLGACTKARNSSMVRDQPRARIPAKPRAYSFKPQYLNYIIQRDFLKNAVEADSILEKARAKKLRSKTIEGVIKEEFAPFIGRTDKEIMATIGWMPKGKPKNFKRLLVNKILGVESDKIEELEKANVTLKVVTLEPTGTLRESISFPAFDYKELVNEVWYDEENEIMSDFHAMLESKKFLFVVFQKIRGANDIVLRKTMFWNFPINDLFEAQNVWEKTVQVINEGKYDQLPKMKDSPIAHVRPHGKDGSDKIETPQGAKEMKRSFWLNAAYIQQAIESDKDQS